MPDSKGSFLLRPQARLPRILDTRSMKAQRPRTPSRKAASAQLWDSVETAASGMPALLGETACKFYARRLWSGLRRMAVLYACRAAYERGCNYVSVFRQLRKVLAVNSGQRSGSELEKR